MIKIDYPVPAFKIKTESQQEFIFDTNRKKWVLLTPEEWVRQNMLQYLEQVMHYPASLIAIEKSIKLGELTKRFDILVYKDNVPWMIIECKEANEKIADKTITQLYQYQQVLNAEYLIASNGHETVGAQIKSGKLHALQNFPEYL
jgi:hypothetical protein